MRIRILLALGLVMLPLGAGADTLRAAVGRPVQKAEALIQAGNYPAALKALRQADAAGPLTPYESTVVAQLRGTAEAGAGDYAQAAVAYQTVLASGTQPAPARLQFAQAIAGFYYQAADYPHTVTWVNQYIAAGGTDARTRALLAQAYFQQGDYAQAEHAVQREEAAAQRQGQPLPEAELQLLAYSAQKNNDQDGYFTALQALLINYPSPAYWNEAISLLTASPDFPDSLTLDVYRLRLATHTLTAPGDYEDYTERAILAGAPQEARLVIDQGFASGILNDATDNGHAARLKTLADSNAAPAEAVPADPLQQGIAQYQAGQKALAAATFNKLASNSLNDPDAALARLWEIRAQDSTP